VTSVLFFLQNATPPIALAQRASEIICMKLIHRDDRAVGLLLLELRALIVAGEITPPWTVHPEPVSNDEILRQNAAEYRRIAKETQDSIRRRRALA